MRRTLILVCSMLALLASAQRRRQSQPVAAGGLQEYLSHTESEINAVEAKYARQQAKPIAFGCNMILAHGAIVDRVPDNVLIAYADGLKDSGAQRVEINPIVTSRGAAASAAKYDALVQHIRRIGVKLAINPESTPSERGGIRSFDQYQQQALKDFAEWASRYKPDEFVLVHEPTTMSARMHIETTPAQWRGFIEATAKVVKHASPSTRIGAGCFAGTSAREMPFFDEFAKIGELQFLTFDNYIGSADAIARMEQMAKTAHDARKPVYMEETWRPHFVEPGTRHVRGKSMESESAMGFGAAEFEPLDAKWLQAMALFAATHDLESITAFQTRCFFAYVSSGPTDGPEYDKVVEQAILQKKRTETFKAFQELVRKYGARR